jgi:hypothetical protein
MKVLTLYLIGEIEKVNKCQNSSWHEQDILCHYLFNMFTATRCPCVTWLLLQVPNLGYWHNMCLEVLRKTTKNLSQNDSSPGWDLNQRPLKYKAGVLITPVRHSVRNSISEFSSSDDTKSNSELENESTILQEVHCVYSGKKTIILWF